MLVLMHDGVHGSLFRSARTDRWAAFAMGAPALVAASAYRVTHMRHHRYLGSDKDPETTGIAVCKTQHELVALFYASFLMGTHLDVLGLPRVALTLANQDEQRMIRHEYTLIAAALVAALAVLAGLDHLPWIMWYWLIPLQIAYLIASIRGLAEHHGVEGEHDVNATRSVTWSNPASFLILNVNFHLEHHLLAAIPWYNLRKAHQVLHSSLAKHGAEYSRSYASFALESFVDGPGDIKALKAQMIRRQSTLGGSKRTEQNSAG